MRWYENIYLSESIKNNRLYYQFILKHTRKITGTYLLTLSDNGSDLIDIYRSEIFQIPGMFSKDQLVIGIAGTKFEALELAGKIISDVYNKTDSFDLSAYFN